MQRLGHRYTRVFSDARTAGLAGAQIAAQALFFFVIPRALSMEASASVLLAYVFASAFGQLTPFGVQFALLRAFVQGDRVRIARLRGALWLTLPLTALAMIIFSVVYGWEAGAPPLVVGVTLVSFTSRTIASAVHQARGTYHWVQVGTIVATVSRTAAIVASGVSDFVIALVTIESVIALGWYISARPLWVSHARSRPTREDVRQSGAFFASAVSRVFLLDVDKLLFAAVASPDAFVAYALVSRVYGGASSFSAAYFARETPRVVRSSTRSELLAVTMGALPTAVIGLTVLVVATAAAAVVYPDLWIEFAYSAMLLAIALVANLANTPLLDYLFYNRSVFLRIAIQVFGVTIVVCGTAFGARFIGAVAPAASVMISSVVTAGTLLVISRRMFSRC